MDGLTHLHLLIETKDCLVRCSMRACMHACPHSYTQARGIVAHVGPRAQTQVEVQGQDPTPVAAQPQGLGPEIWSAKGGRGR